jgi:hypothetical protein
MTHNNLVLTEKAIKNHSKRLKKEMMNYGNNLSLGECQKIFSKILGFNNFHELQSILIKNNFVAYNLYEKHLFVIMHLILDNNNKLAFKLINEFYSDGIDSFIINLLFDKYTTNKFAIDIHNKYKQKELIFINLLDLVRRKMPFPCAYFLFLKNLDSSLWNLIFYSGRPISVIKDEKLITIFRNYQLNY